MPRDSSTNSSTGSSVGHTPSFINPETLAPAKGYSNGVLMPPGSLLFVAGQIGWDRHENLVANTFVLQFRQALQNVLDVVVAAGGGAESIARLTMYTTDKQAYLADLKAVGSAYREVLGRHFPAMALVEVADLVEDGALIEIEATAVIQTPAKGKEKRDD